MQLFSQNTANYSGKVVDNKNNPLPNVLVLNGNEILTVSDSKGEFLIEKKALKNVKKLLLFLENYKTKEVLLQHAETQSKIIILEPIAYTLSEVVIRNRNVAINDLRTLRDVEEMSINIGRKNEVVLLKDMTINKVTNNARQIFSKVVGVTINESSEGGLQLNIGGRGLNPNRTANFNTRQNGYDISADVLGYPESYYTPPAEAVREIQVIRGASSLQYGTQFGGMVNFKMGLPHHQKIHLNQRLSYGSHNLMSSFTNISGTLKNFSYYTYFNYKKGDGFRPNSKYQSLNGFVNLNYKFGEKSSIHLDWLKYNYLAKQPGGLTNYMFYQDPWQSNRTRNWFRVDWNILNLKYKYNFNKDTRISLQGFGLLAERSALGYRSYRVSQPDEPNSPRDLLIGKFKNWGLEARFIKSYTLKERKHTLLTGFKYYQSKNSSQQGAGSSSDDADFTFARDEFPYYERQSAFDYPNLNFAFFAENIFKIGKNTSITPGIRLEKIKTQSIGEYRIIAEFAGIILNDTTISDDVVKDRYVLLGGVSISHKMNKLELYGNLSQNYRSITFSDIHSFTPGFAIATDITDEKGYSSDIGLRGKLNDVLYFDCSLYALYYGDKIGEYYHVNKKTGAVERYRDNVGTAFTYGFESLINWNINKTFWDDEHLISNIYLNTAFTGSEYLSSDVPNIEGNAVEFVPLVNLKAGIEFGYKNLLVNTQLSYVSSQFAEATNQDTPDNENQYGVFGKIPAYYVIDLSASYKIKKHLKLEGTIQNVTNNAYFTQRATGYPGPGIIPSPPLNYVLSLVLDI